ncbi:hypothetical protein EXIGLDRAFT_760610 [Exidia glandulosa HHB12029]|uniref:Uncharacterized protein n=1 Tax=Exidia glandulosa HHB12029 TaxID=1314781 RepID=A0A165C4F9_EXIGL|nr:hypothetical protein EXIGLDRAFT_783927 [Exidia glandulosa HHB12029]KZV81796.1 hypothetical protein EXIGLDRAFT_779343 [Exidia glandulosa HHB12029]KZW01705.1 hypothetical protein EXIGLDRAFT_760610 [Exidia glandulosa HHB12029]
MTGARRRDLLLHWCNRNMDENLMPEVLCASRNDVQERPSLAGDIAADAVFSSKFHGDWTRRHPTQACRTRAPKETTCLIFCDQHPVGTLLCIFEMASEPEVSVPRHLAIEASTYPTTITR